MRVAVMAPLNLGVRVRILACMVHVHVYFHLLRSKVVCEFHSVTPHLSHTGLQAGAPFGTDIIRMRAMDSDSGGSGTSYTFSIKDSEFIDSNLKVRHTFTCTLGVVRKSSS